MPDLSQNVPAQNLKNVPTILKCPNYLKMSQLSQNVPTKDLKMYQLPPKSNFTCIINISESIFHLAKIRFLRKYAGWLNLCEIVWEILNYAKRRGKSQIVRKFAGSVILCNTAPAAPKYWLWYVVVLIGFLKPCKWTAIEVTN